MHQACTPVYLTEQHHLLATDHCCHNVTRSFAPTLYQPLFFTKICAAKEFVFKTGICDITHSGQALPHIWLSIDRRNKNCFFEGGGGKNCNRVVFSIF